MKKKAMILLLITMIILNMSTRSLAVLSESMIKEIDKAQDFKLVPYNLLEDLENPITREEFCAIAVRLYERATGVIIEERVHFNDTNNIDVQKIGGLGIVKGVGNGKFNPNGDLTREQAAVILARLATKIGYELLDGEHQFADESNMSNWAIQEIKQMEANGIMNGIGNNRFFPQGKYTRAQSIVTILRLNDKYFEPILTDENIYNAIISLKDEYPDGMPWTNDDYYSWNGGIYSGGYGCAAFAFMLSDAAFGKLPAIKHEDFDNTKLGDIIRINRDTHSVIVTKIEGDNVTIAEGNFNSAIRWGRVYTLDEIKSIGTYILTRY